MRINSNLIRLKTYHFGSDKIFQLLVIKMRFISIVILRKSILGTCLKHSDNAKNCPEAYGEPGWEQNPSTHEVIKRICPCEGCFGQRRSHRIQLLPPAPAQARALRPEQRLCKSFGGAGGARGFCEQPAGRFSVFLCQCENTQIHLPIALLWTSEALQPSRRLLGWLTFSSHCKN